MDLEDIKTEYKYFLEYLSASHSILQELNKKINDDLTSYCKQKNFDKNFTEKLEINLINMENLYEMLDEVYSNTEKLSLHELKLQPHINKTKKYTPIIPSEDEIIIEVPADAKIDWERIIKKSNFKLYINKNFRSK